MKKILEFLRKAKHYVGLAIKYLGQLLGVIKKAEEELAEKTEEVAEDKAGE